jgi:hypothetical protein
MLNEYGMADQFFVDYVGIHIDDPQLFYVLSELLTSEYQVPN